MRRYRKKHKWHHKNSDDSGVIWTVITIVILYALCWIIFWLWVIWTIALLVYWVHWLNKRYGWYKTKCYYIPILAYLLTISSLLIWWSRILFKLGKIDKIFLSRAIEGSNYVIIEPKAWKILINPNADWIAQKLVVPNQSSIWTKK